MQRTSFVPPPSIGSRGLDRMLRFPGHQIRRAHQIAVALFMEELAPFDLTPVQLAALTTIADEENIDATRLSRLVGFDKSTLGNVLERLESKELIARESRAEDKRSKRLRLTERGRALLAATGDAVERSQRRFLDVLAEDEQEQLRGLLGK